jgi:hypothetical protein
MTRLTLVVTLLLCPVASEAQQYERFLLPVYFSEGIRGEHGSLWRVRFTAHNPTEADFHIEWCSPEPPVTPCPGQLLQSAWLETGETQDVLPAVAGPDRGIHGRVLYVRPFPSPPGDPRALAFQLRIVDESRTALNAGTAVPVIRESQFLRTTAHLLNVPRHPNFRLLLRIYELDLPEAEFAIRTYDHATGNLVNERRMTLTMPPQQGSLRFDPGYAEVADLVDGLVERFRVEVEPLTEGSAFWTVVSITNNESQHVTLVTPQ